MSTVAQLLRQGRRDEVWQKYCGFLDLTIQEFMDIQEDLLLDQLGLINNSILGKELLGGAQPKTLEEFRECAPLTTYSDYANYLSEKREDVLPEPPVAWMRTSGRSGEFGHKWVPYTERMLSRLGEQVATGLILGAANGRNDVRISPADTALLVTAPPPYLSGFANRAAEKELEVQFLPDLDKGDQMEFGDRLQTGFTMALNDGLDHFYGIASVLARIGDAFATGGGVMGGSLSWKLLRPNIVWRLVKGYLTAKMAGRDLMPKDLWNVKGIVTGGSDTVIYKEKVEHYWGRKPIEGYGCTEGLLSAIQAWNASSYTFVPDCCFYEFIPYEDHIKSKTDKAFPPRTLLMDELEPGVYEIVLSNFLGGAFIRYRIGDLLEVIALEDREIQVGLPQFRFYSRGNDIIDIGAMVRLTEKTIWTAIENANVAYTDWGARKRVEESHPVFELLLELKEAETRSADELREAIRTALKHVEPDYGAMEEILQIDPLQITLLPPGAFDAYMNKKRAEGADLAHIKPPHMQPTNEAVEALQGHSEPELVPVVNESL